MFSQCSLSAFILHWLLHHILFLRRHHTLTSKDFQLFVWGFFGKVFQVKLFELAGFSRLTHFPSRSSSHLCLLLIDR